jgi:hypothetical protein
MKKQKSMNTFECCCCFDSDIGINKIIECPKGHLTCTECIERSLKVAVGNRDYAKCPHESNCGETFSELALCRATQDLKLKKAYDNIVAVKSIKDSGLENIYSCPFCDNIVVQDGEFNLFHCTACERASCVKCKKEKHEGSCDIKRRKEEEETEKLILTCLCKTALVRADGCNKLICINCKTIWCWICKTQLKAAKPYDHFGKSCKLYGERPKNQQAVASSSRDPVPVPVPNLLVVNQPVRRRVLPFARPREGICTGIIRRNGQVCKNKAKYGNFCGMHRGQVPVAVAVEVLG